MSAAAFWNKAAPKYAKSEISNMDAYRVTLERMKEILQPHHRVLELGCGTGSTAVELAPGVDRYIGTDVSDKMIDIAQSKVGDNQHQQFAVHGADDIPNPPHDVILALNLLHLLPDLDGTLRAIHRALPPGGLFIAKTGLLRDGNWLLRPAIKVMQAIGKAPYVGVMSAQDLTGKLKGAGFEITETLLQPDIAPRLFTVARKA